MKRSTRRLSVAICLLFAATSQGATNPNIGANGLFLMGYTKREDPEGAPTSRTGFYAQRMEVQMDAALDSTLHSTLTLALPAGENPQLIEGYLSARFRSGLMLQAGRFYVDFGQHNALHAHQFPFLDMPLVLERFFFTESLNEVGIGLSKALPLPWRSSWSAQIVNGDNPLWVSKTDEDFLLVTRLRNEWNIGAERALLWGLSWAGGRNVKERFTSVYGVDARLQLGAQLLWQGEYLLANENLKTHTTQRGGFYSFVKYQTTKRSWAQVRYDLYGLPEDGDEGENRISILLGFAAHKLLPLRFQYSRWRIEREGRGYNQYHIQLNFSMGSHFVP